MSPEELVYLDPNELVADSNIRSIDDEKAMEGLMESIRQAGLLQPARVQLVNGRYALMAGFRRIQAAKMLGMEKVPCIVETKCLSEKETIQQQFISNLQIKGMTPIEEAINLRRLMMLGKETAAEAGQSVGMKQCISAKRLKLLGLPSDIRNMVDAGIIPASCGYELAKIDDPEQQAALAERFKGGHFTRDALLQAMRSTKRKQASKCKRPKRVIASLGNNRTISVSSPDLDFDLFVSALQELLSEARRERKRGLALDTFLKLLRDRCKDSPTATEGEQDA